MPQTKTYKTNNNITVKRNTTSITYQNAIEPLLDKLNNQRGVLLTSSFEYPGRYTRWDIGFVNPPLVITTEKQQFKVQALNGRGEILLPVILQVVSALNYVKLNKTEANLIEGEILITDEYFPEELRSKQPSVFSLLRAIVSAFYSTEDEYLGLYGAFGYDLAFQFEPIKLKIPREKGQRDLVLYLPDEIYVIDHRKETADIYQYEFVIAGKSTERMPNNGLIDPYIPATKIDKKADHEPGEYAKIVDIAKQSFKRGDLFEVVPGQSFFEACDIEPAEIFRRLRERNPAPYSFIMNLGEQEYLVGASPEMYVRVQGKRVETCPISGTIARGKDAINDASQILQLLNSAKEASELTMCTDVDRNDKSRVCEPGSVKVLSRRQIEMYSRVIHTVDHVEGYLRDGYDALDAFLTHTWAVTVTGAPKKWAMQFIENYERSPRRWYGGAIGVINFDGNMNTGLTLRTVRIKNGVAEVRAGATLLFDSVPMEEEKETHLKSSALLDAIRRPRTNNTQNAASTINTIGNNKRILLVDHQDSFVHTLANYLRQTGAEVLTLRNGFNKEKLNEIKPDLIVLSPGPGCPSDFNLSVTIKMALDANIPIFGICLGLQGLVEYFGGKLDILDYPVHGKPSEINILGGKLFKELPSRFVVGRYHSLYANKATFPDILEITAETSDEIVMAIEHKQLPIWAVQFHPESILSLENNAGMRIIENVIKLI